MADWKKIVGAVAPTLARALGGPLAGMAVSAIATKLGVDVDEKSIDAAIASGGPELLLKLHQADQEFAAKMAELDVDLEKVAAGDRDSARKRQVELHDPTPNILALIILTGFFAVQWFVVTHVIPEASKDIVGRTLGTLDMMTGAVVFYFFGSSKGSTAKDRTIDREIAKK